MTISARDTRSTGVSLPMKFIYLMYFYTTVRNFNLRRCFTSNKNADPRLVTDMYVHSTLLMLHIAVMQSNINMQLTVLALANVRALMDEVIQTKSAFA